MYLHKRTPKRSNLRDFSGLYSSLLGQKPVLGQAFNFSVAIGSDFTFSMDTGSKAASPVIKKKASPSTLRRNARSREEYLQRKKNPSKVKSTEEVETVSDALSCDQCDYKPASEKGLKQHKRMKHKTPQSKESLRQSEEGLVSLSASLILPIETYFVRCQHLTNRNLFSKMPASYQ